MRQQIGAALGCRVRDAYGASEAFSIAAPCEHGTLHVNSDWVIVEPVDRLYRPVRPGELSHTTLVTNLANLTQPLIRYDLGDRVTWLDTPCPCGSPFPAIRVEGRRDDLLQMEDGAGRAVMLLPLAVETVLETHGAAYRFQVVRTSATSLALRVESQRPRSAQMPQRARRALVGFLKAQGLANVRVDLDKGPIRCSHASGKLQRVITASRSVVTTATTGGDTAPSFVNDA
jgi:phenylacetate-coenzyme A ligase PaaK-like adenylate-forming protein